MELKIGNTYSDFLLEDIKKIKEIDSKLHLFIHKKTKARLIYLKNKQKNNVFVIGFRTTPKNDTGVAHILEHSVLCGSRKYPIKDPFSEILKSSITTFLNAFTFPDKTIYPFSTNNPKEFDKVIDIYLDAVFFPNVLENENIFLQEGWRYELNNPKDEIKYSGVVYGEMKGVFSSPLNILNRNVNKYLFPNNIYKYESDGEPSAIVKLSYDDLKKFHKEYYHPSNSYLYISGDCNIFEKLEFINDEYLSKFKKIKPDSEIQLEKSFKEKIEKEITYNVNKNEDLNNKTFIADSYVIGKSSNTKEILGFEILDNILFNMASSPLKKELLNANLAENVFSVFDDEFRQPIYSIILQNTNNNNSIKKKYKEILKNKLTELSKGIDRNLIIAAVNKKEFELKENVSSINSPFIDTYLNLMTTFLYDDKDYINKLTYERDLDYIKKHIEENFFEKLIKKYLLKNNHSCLLTLKPKHGEDFEIKIREKLKTFKKSLSEKKIKELIKKTNEVNSFIRTPDSEKDIASIKKIDLKDINPVPERFKFTKFKKPELGDVIFNNLNENKTKTSNGITYLNFYFDVNYKNLSIKKLQYLSLLTSVLEEVKTKNYSDLEFSNLLNSVFGEFEFNIKNYYNIKTKKNSTKIIFNSKFLKENKFKIIPLINEYFNEVKFEKEKILEIIQRVKSNLQIKIVQEGHIFSALKIKEKNNLKGKLDELTKGFKFYSFLKELEENFKKNGEDILNELNNLYDEIFTINKKTRNLLISISSQDKNIDFLNKLNIKNKKLNISKSKKIHDEISLIEEINLEKNNIKSKTAIASQSLVNYVGLGGNSLSLNKELGHLEVIKTYLRYDYLWNKIRVDGGAYGCVIDLDFLGNLSFNSYRDPNLARSLKIFKEFPNHLREKKFSDDKLLKLIIGTIGTIDKPINDDIKLRIKTDNYLSGIDFEFIKRIRAQILNTKKFDLNKLVKIFEEIFSQDKIVVIGNATQINENENLFDEILKL